MPKESAYSKKLKDPRWQRKRLEIFQRDDWRCTNCLLGDLTLHCHHLKYIRGLEPWEHPSETLTTLCEVCHGLAHVDVLEAVEKLGESLAGAGWGSLEIHALSLAFSHAADSDFSPSEVATLLGFVVVNAGTLRAIHEMREGRRRQSTTLRHGAV